MKNRMIQISKGIIRIETPKPVLSKDRLSGIVLPDKKMMLEVSIACENRVPMQLFFYSLNERVSVPENVSVVTAGKIALEINTVGLALGDVISGTVDILYNGGELALPYSFTVGMAKDGENEYAFATLEAFRAFAEENFRTAVHIFSWKEFLGMPFMKSLHLLGLYNTFYSTAADDSGMCAFLKAAGMPLETKPEKDPAEKVEKVLFTPAGISKNELRRTQYFLTDAYLKVERMLQSGLSVSEGMKEVRALRKMSPDNTTVILFTAYVLLKSGKTEKAKELLLSVQDEVQKERLEKKDIYCLFLLLASTLQGDPDRKDSTVRLIRKYRSEGTATLLMTLLDYRVNPEYRENPVSAASYLRDAWLSGLKNTPVLFETVSLWTRETPSLSVLSDYELTAALYGLRKNMLTEKKLFEILGHELKNPAYLNLYTEVLKEGYYQFKNIDLLHAVMNVFLQKHWTGARYFFWYAEAIQRDMTLTGLCEAYLQSAPKSTDEPMPRRIIEYFGYAKEQRMLPVELLYANVLTHYAADEAVMDLYREKIDAFAMERMKAEYYSVLMEPIYESILDSAHLNENTAHSMLKLFSLYEIGTAIPEAVRVIIHYPQLNKEDYYGLISGKAMVPVFSEEAILAFENRKGERFFDPDMTRKAVFSNDELRNQCALYINDSLILKLNEADHIVKEGVLRDRDLYMVTDFIKDKRIVPFYRARLYETLVDLSMKPSMQHIDCTEFIMEADFADFTKEYRTKLIEMLVERDYVNLALDRAVTYGTQDLSDTTLLKLMEEAVLQPFMAGSNWAVAQCFSLFKKELASVQIEQFLAKYFRGNIRNLMAIIRPLRKKHHELSELPYRAMAVSFFTGNTRELDSLFDIYLQEKVRDDTAIKAYLVLRSHEYFVYGRKLTDSCTEVLKRNVKSLPAISTMALLTRYGEAENRTDEENEQALYLIRTLIRKNIYLSCYRKFMNLPNVPFELLNRMYVEYCSEEAAEVTVSGYVMPGRHYFHRVLSEVYPGVFVQSFVLYKREWLEFSYRLALKNGEEQEKDGIIMTQEDSTLHKTGHVVDLLNLEKKIRNKDDRETAETLRSMLYKEGMVKELFGRGNEWKTGL